MRLIAGSHRWLLLAALSLLTLALGSAMFSGADFSSRSANSASLATGSFQLASSVPNQTIVSAAKMKPGQSREGTIKITNESVAAGTVVLRASGLTGTALAAVIDLKVEEGATQKWTGKLGAFASVDLGSIGAGASRTFKLVLSWPSASNSASLQGASTSLTFQWSGSWSAS